MTKRQKTPDSPETPKTVLQTRENAPNPANPLLPSAAVMDKLDEVFNTPVTSPFPSDRDSILREGSNLMIENGFGGRGIIPVKDNPRKPDLAYRLFIANLKDDKEHTALKAALSIVGTPQAERFLSLLFSLKKRKTPVEVLAKQCGIGIPQLREIWRTAKLDQGLMALLDEYPGAMKDVARDARSTKEACKFCSGTGKIIDENAPQPKPTPAARGGRRGRDKYDLPEPEPVMVQCHSCAGRGWVRKSGDKDARSLMGQILGVSGKVAPLFGGNTTNIHVESVINEIEQMAEAENKAQRVAGTGIYDATPETAE